MKRITLLFALTGFCMVSYCQHSHLTVDGIISEGNKKLKDATITVYKNGKVADQITSTNGKFALSLAYDQSFVLEFSKQGYVSKKLEVNTSNVTCPEQKNAYIYSGFNVRLFKEKEGTDYAHFENPVGVISYNACSNKFESKLL